MDQAPATPPFSAGDNLQQALPAPAADAVEVRPDDTVPAEVPQEVFPASIDPYGGLIKFNSPPASKFDLWVAKNVAPLLVIFVCLTMFVLTAFVPRPERTVPPAPTLPNPSAKAPSSLHKNQSGVPMADEVLWQTQFNALLWMGGFALLVLLGIPEIRKWVVFVATRMTIRPLPAIRGMDFVAAFLVYPTASHVIAVLLLPWLVQLSTGELNAVSLILNDLGLLLAVATAAWLCRFRARGAHGSSGIWPFWTLSKRATSRSIWWDIGLGILVYPVAFWLTGITALANHWIVKSLGRSQDHHMLEGALAEPQERWVIGVFFIAAVGGAAIFEEILFRGMLYNVLRRYLGTLSGAILAAAAFSAVHRIESQLLPLFVLALVLTWLYDSTGRLVANITLHAVNNLVALLMLLFLSRHG